MNKILFFDMEWVPIAKDFKILENTFPEHAAAWSRRCDKWRTQDKFAGLSNDQLWEQESGFYPEFIQIICISAGYWKDKGGEKVFAIDSFYGDNEKDILEKMRDLLSKTAGTYKLCGHSIKRFDMPYLAKRMAIHGMKIPWDLNNGSKKPWEIDSIDIAEEWGFGCNAEKFTPLDWMCAALDVPTPKSDISGKEVKNAYYEDNRLEDIKNYCEADVKATALVYEKIYKVTSSELSI